MPNVFISYRRTDSAPYAGRIYDRLVVRFGRKSIFKDVDSIPPGMDFSDYILQALRKCSAVLVVIGPSWLDERTAEGHRRLDDPSHFVRVENELSLQLHGSSTNASVELSNFSITLLTP